MNMFQRRLFYHAATLSIAMALTITAGWAQADQSSGPAAAPSVGGNSCSSLPTYAQLQTTLASALTAENSGLNNQMWATIVDRDGVVCAVAFSGVNRGAQWPGSRVISAQKANTANAFSLDSSSAAGTNGKGQPTGLALSTANLYSSVQPGGSLYGLQASNPVEASVAYEGAASRYGQANDPMVGNKIGGVNVFGGGLALYAAGKVIVGGVGVSGDTSCTDHDVAWRLRHNLGLDHLAGAFAVSGDSAHPDNIVYDIVPNMFGGVGISKGGFGHPTCLNYNPNPANTLPAVQP
jgi:uncharacterized protein GlcG (DUF336 family)